MPKPEHLRNPSHEHDAPIVAAAREGGERLGPLRYSIEEQSAFLRESVRAQIRAGFAERRAIEAEQSRIQDAATVDAIRTGGERLGPLPFDAKEQDALVRESLRRDLFLGDTLHDVGVTVAHPAVQDTFTRLHSRAKAIDEQSRERSR